MSSVRTLVVENHEQFRRFVCMSFATMAEFQVIAEVADGLEAVRRSEELQPDLVVLDIGLPGINGIEAARRIRKLCPDSRILFLSLESDPEVVEEAIRVGALGYVDKKRVGRDLLAAAVAVCQGRQFISSGLLSGNSMPVSCGLTWVPPDPQSDSLRTAGLDDCSHHHEVQFYSDDSSFLASLGAFVSGSLKAGQRTVVVATELHREALQRYLRAQDFDFPMAIGQRLYIPLDAAEVLSMFMESPGPNRQRFRATLGPLVACTGAQQKKVVVFGEMVALLCAEGKMTAALQLERLWNELLKGRNLSLRCAYPIVADIKEDRYADILAEHSAVLPALRGVNSGHSSTEPKSKKLCVQPEDKEILRPVQTCPSQPPARDGVER
jgi:CheY-like chemotaxis protein